jgi:hypothetical protein
MPPKKQFPSSAIQTTSQKKLSNPSNETIPMGCCGIHGNPAYQHHWIGAGCGRSS